MKYHQPRDWPLYSSYMQSLGGEAGRLIQFVDWVTELADTGIDSYSSNLDSDVLPRAVRAQWESAVSEAERSIVVTPEMLSEALYIFVTYWIYGEELAKVLTLFETILLKTVVFTKLAVAQEEAKNHVMPEGQIEPLDRPGQT